MNKRAGLSYFILALLCFGLLNIKFERLERIRGPFFGFEELFALSSIDSKAIEFAELKTENLHLKQQINEVKSYLLSEVHIEDICSKCMTYASDETSEHSAFYRRKLGLIISFLNMSKWQITANVIYREPATWSSALWIDVGSNNNKLLNKTIVAVDSPVVLGDYLIGVIEKVDKNKSLVRLITDSRISPSVRCVRGNEQLAFIHRKCKNLKDLLSLYPSSTYKVLRNALDDQIADFTLDGQASYLAKGLLNGSSNPIWRSRSLTLQGTGFNYDFGDDEGPPRSLHDYSEDPLFQKGDALLTTGMDGIFPANLLVAFVTEVSPLKEGDVSCKLKARIALDEFSNLSKVTILPPL